jgi:sarcosine oxidase subunit alpha
MTDIDTLIIGGGPAGLAAAIAAREAGCENLVLLERDAALGGILKQCIHTGFGLHVFKEELTGPEYAQRFVAHAAELGIPVECGTTVLRVTRNREVTAVSAARGLQTFRAKAVVLAMGCRERPRGALMIPGWRPAGVYTAGTAQRMVNIEGWRPGRRVVILGSGDIGLIMARRMTFEGARVLACVELMPYSSGLTRNVVQCLDDFGIPLLLGHTVVEIHGRERVEGVTVAQVDGRRLPVTGTERRIACDTVLLSVGLVPENELSREAGVTLSSATAGPLVDASFQTDVPGVFACGNVLHVHDLVDRVTMEARCAGGCAAAFARTGETKFEAAVRVVDGPGVRGVVPQRLYPGEIKDGVSLTFRPVAVSHGAVVVVKADGEEALRKSFRVLTPGEMVEVALPQAALARCAAARAVSVEVVA